MSAAIDAGNGKITVPDILARKFHPHAETQFLGKLPAENRVSYRIRYAHRAPGR